MKEEMDYSPTPLLDLQPDKPFRELTRKEARAYFKSFMELIPERIPVLERAVVTSPKVEYKNWKADKTPESLHILGQWFADQVFTVPVSEKFKQMYQARIEAAPPKIKPLVTMSRPEWVLSDLTFWALYDVGMYFGETLCATHPQLKWELYTKGKNWEYYHEPVITGFKQNLVYNPVEMAHITAHKFAKRNDDPPRLFEIFKRWTSHVEN